MSELGDYLRARRDQVSPESVHLVAGDRRRVPGLRREEVALLAGVSMDYYVRLEQGRERSPSAQVVDALATVLRLDDDARLHLFRTAGLAPRPRPGAASRRVDPGLRQLMEAWSAQPALVFDRSYDVLAANELADALFGWAPGADRDNLMELVFLEPRGRELYADWARGARDSVAGFRLGHGIDPDDGRTRELLARLLADSPEFARLWSTHDARGKRNDTKDLRHPEVGPLTLEMQTFDVRAAPGQELVVYHAAPGTPSADALALLGTLAATARRTRGPGAGMV